MKRLITIAVAVAALAVLLPSAAPTASQPSAPTGATGLALSSAVELAWQPVAGATSYNVYRGSTVIFPTLDALESTTVFAPKNALSSRKSSIKNEVVNNGRNSACSASRART